MTMATILYFFCFEFPVLGTVNPPSTEDVAGGNFNGTCRNDITVASVAVLNPIKRNTLVYHRKLPNTLKLNTFLVWC